MHCLQSVGHHFRHSAEIVGEEIKSTSSQYLNVTDRVTDDLHIPIRIPRSA